VLTIHSPSPQDLRLRVADLTRQFDEAKKQLEGEVLMRVDLDNRCQGLKEELAFKIQVSCTHLTLERTTCHFDFFFIRAFVFDMYILKGKCGKIFDGLSSGRLIFISIFQFCVCKQSR